MEVPLEPSWMGDNFEFSEPDFYKQVVATSATPLDGCNEETI